MLGIIAIAAIIIIIAWYFLKRPLNYWKNLGVKESKPCIVFGDSLDIFLKRTSFSDFIKKLYNMHPGSRYSGFYNFNTPKLVLRDPELIKQITIKEFDSFSDHPPFIDPDTEPLWSSALLSLKGERWKEMRNILSPSYTSSKIKNIYAKMLETADNFVKYFMTIDEEVIEVNMRDAFTRIANDIIATTAFGVTVDSLKDKTNIFFEMGKRLTEFSGILAQIKFIGHDAFPKLMKYLGVSFLDKKATQYFTSVIAETIKVREEQNIVRPDMIHLMLEARRENNAETSGVSDTGKSKTIKITDLEITSQAMIFFFGGFDTVATALCFGTYELALQKDVQDRLREEIMDTQKDGKVTYDQLTQMKYLDMVVSETLRKWSPFVYIDRLCTKPYTIEPTNADEKPVPIKVDQEVWIPIHGIQRDPKWFPNPEKFDPERFSDGNKNNIVPYTYMPFGVGPRNCIGNRLALLEIKALLFNLLLHYELVPTKKTPIPLVLAKELNPIPEGGFWLGLKRIKLVGFLNEL